MFMKKTVLIVENQNMEYVKNILKILMSFVGCQMNMRVVANDEIICTNEIYWLFNTIMSKLWQR